MKEEEDGCSRGCIRPVQGPLAVPGSHTVALNRHLCLQPGADVAPPCHLVSPVPQDTSSPWLRSLLGLGKKRSGEGELQALLLTSLLTSLLPLLLTLLFPLSSFPCFLLAVPSPTC